MLFFCPPRGICQCLGTFLLSGLEEEVASGLWGVEARMLVNILQAWASPPLPWLKHQQGCSPVPRSGKGLLCYGLQGVSLSPGTEQLWPSIFILRPGEQSWEPLIKV